MFDWVLNTLWVIISYYQRFDRVKSVRIWSFSGSYFPVFGLNTVRYGVSPNAGKYGPEKL